jgi:hypothetical protein
MKKSSRRGKKKLKKSGKRSGGLYRLTGRVLRVSDTHRPPPPGKVSKA